MKWVSGSRDGETVSEAAATGQPPVQLRQVLDHLVLTETRLGRVADGAPKAWRWCAVNNNWILNWIYMAIILTAVDMFLMHLFVTLMCHCSFRFRQ